MKGVGPLVIAEKGKTLRIRGRAAGDFLRTWGLRPMYVSGAWVVDRSHGPDLAAWCECENVRYRWESEQ